MSAADTVYHNRRTVFVCGASTGHVPAAVAFCGSEGRAAQIARAVNSYDTHRALIAELVGAIENTLPRLRADTDDPEGIDWSAEIAAFEAVVAKAKSESAP